MYFLSSAGLLIVVVDRLRGCVQAQNGVKNEKIVLLRVGILPLCRCDYGYGEPGSTEALMMALTVNLLIRPP
ncbi:hypothetical protein HMPREF1861_00357 [Corynebacterium kroppenstedtii]|nr:hypothetical protein HMPREF1861_00357 [Corynebacterium kroppenstedtii]